MNTAVITAHAALLMGALLGDCLLPARPVLLMVQIKGCAEVGQGAGGERVFGYLRDNEQHAQLDRIGTTQHVFVKYIH